MAVRKISDLDRGGYHDCAHVQMFQSYPNNELYSSQLYLASTLILILSVLFIKVSQPKLSKQRTFCYVLADLLDPHGMSQFSKFTSSISQFNF